MTGRRAGPTMARRSTQTRTGASQGRSARHQGAANDVCIRPMADLCRTHLRAGVAGAVAGNRSALARTRRRTVPQQRPPTPNRSHPPNSSLPTGRSRRCGRWPSARVRLIESKRSPTASRCCLNGVVPSSCQHSRSRRASRSRSTASSPSASSTATRTRKPARRQPWRPTPPCATCSRHSTSCAKAATPRRCCGRSATRCWPR